VEEDEVEAAVDLLEELKRGSVERGGRGETAEEEVADVNFAAAAAVFELPGAALAGAASVDFPVSSLPRLKCMARLAAVSCGMDVAPALRRIACRISMVEEERRSAYSCSEK
jgi:hypothetical protein